MPETYGFLFFLMGLTVILLLYLLSRVSNLTRMVNKLGKMLKEAETNKALISQGDTKPVPNAVIAAISAAVNQYRLDNN